MRSPWPRARRGRRAAVSNETRIAGPRPRDRRRTASRARSRAAVVLALAAALGRAGLRAARVARRASRTVRPRRRRRRLVASPRSRPDRDRCEWRWKASSDRSRSATRSRAAPSCAPPPAAPRRSAKSPPRGALRLEGGADDPHRQRHRGAVGVVEPDRPPRRRDLRGHRSGWRHRRGAASGARARSKCTPSREPRATSGRGSW